MDCLDFRRMAGAEPGSRESEFLRHRLACSACAEHVQALERFDRELQLAMALPPSEGLAARIKTDAALRQGYERRWLAVAASMVLLVGVAAISWQLDRETPVSRALVEHVFHERDMMVASDRRVPVQRVNAVIQQAGVAVHSPIEGVSFATLCPFRGEQVPHLIIDGVDGPVSVMILPNVSVDRAERFDESGLSGTLLPVGQGSIAIIAEPGVDLEAAAARFTDNVDWGI